MNDKAVKIGKSMIKPDPDIIQYLTRPCSWRYRKCLDMDLGKNCYSCKHNSDNLKLLRKYKQNKEHPQKRGKHYYDSIAPVG